MFHGVRSAPRRQTAPHEQHDSEEKVTSVHTFFTTPEHRLLGNRINLSWPDNDTKDTTITLRNASSPSVIFDFQALDPNLNHLCLSYGDITSMAGDFYGTYEPISSGDTPSSRVDRFLASWDLLTRERPTVPEIDRIFKIEHDLQLDPLSRANPSEPPSAVYARMSDFAMTKAWFLATRARTVENGYSKNYPGYLGLVLTNWDHFGEDAHKAYTAGHTAALNLAAGASHGQATPDPKRLKLAYALNAFADHFLEDAFSAGHLRTPRRALHDSELNIGADSNESLASVLLEDLTFQHLPTADLCASLMHDEDSALGLEVENEEHERWTCYGDDYLFDDVGKKTLEICVRALQCSVDEVYEAYTSGTTKPESEYKALRLVPTIESANRTTQKLAPLFKLVTVDDDDDDDDDNDNANNEKKPSGKKTKILRRGTSLQKYTSSSSSSGFRFPIPGSYHTDRTNWSDYTDDFWYATTYLECKASGQWEWPMKL